MPLLHFEMHSNKVMHQPAPTLVLPRLGQLLQIAREGEAARQPQQSLGWLFTSMAADWTWVHQSSKLYKVAQAVLLPKLLLVVAVLVLDCGKIFIALAIVYILLLVKRRKVPALLLLLQLLSQWMWKVLMFLLETTALTLDGPKP